MATLLGKEHFIWKGGGRVEAEQFLPVYFSRYYLQKFFSRDNCTCTRIFIAFYHSPRFISLESSILVPLATGCCIIF